MTLQDCYVKLEGDYAGVLSRLMKDSMVSRFLGMFSKDKSMDELKTAYAAKDWENAFRAVHTLKGTSLNLGITKLAGLASELTESLRNGEPSVDISGMYEAVETEYARTLAIIEEYTNNPE